MMAVERLIVEYSDVMANYYGRIIYYKGTTSVTHSLEVIER